MRFLDYFSDIQVDGLSVGAIVGIVIGCIFGLATLIFCCSCALGKGTQVDIDGEAGTGNNNNEIKVLWRKRNKTIFDSKLSPSSLGIRELIFSLTLVDPLALNNECFQFGF